MNDMISWLLTGPAWIQYCTLVNLLNKEPINTQCSAAYNEMMQDPLINNLLSDVSVWESVVLKRHNDASHPIHKLSFLADIGVSPQNKIIQQVINKIKNHRSEEGPFQILSNYPTHFGGSGKNDWLWCLCDAPTTLYNLTMFEIKDRSAIISAYKHLETMAMGNGWPCSAAKKLGNFRGPGKKSDPCPYANLIMLKIAAVLDLKENKETKIGIETILNLWENSWTKKPYLFKMGTDFQKLKVPFVWYDILHVLDVLSNFKEVHTDPRFLSMLNVVLGKADSNLRYSSESIWTKWKGWEFCQKKEPSRWVTYSILKIQQKVYGLDFL